MRRIIFCRQAFFGFLFSILAAGFLVPSDSGFTQSQPVGFTSEKMTETDVAYIRIPAKTREERSRIANIVPIQEVSDEYVGTFARKDDVLALEKSGIAFHAVPYAIEGFPERDALFHDYQEMTEAIENLQAAAPDIVHTESIGRTLENREIWAIRISDHPQLDENEPAIVFMGNHHAREHLSAEVPLYIAQKLVKNYGQDEKITNLINERAIWIIPMVNPDGVEWDIRDERYHMWRKNRRDNKDGNFGVDLNRNYGFGWGGSGSSGATGSDIYRGPEPFSEPETTAIAEFVRRHADDLKLLLSYHTYSELILYPWGHTYDPVPNEIDRKVMEKMAKTMAEMNGYTPQQSSDLYIASGDTTDWAYGELGIISFTFELYPKGPFPGFYPSDEKIQEVAENNWGPALYMIDLADNPQRAIETPTK